MLLSRLVSLFSGKAHHKEDKESQDVAVKAPESISFEKTIFLKIVLFVLMALQLLFVVWSVTSEQTFYFWDHGMYHAMAKQFFLVPDEIRGALWNQSLGQDYPLFFALPSYLSFSLFGTERLVFILTNFVFFMLPLQLFFGLIVGRVFHLSFFSAWIIATLLSMAIPPLWTPLLEGYPDHAAAALLAGTTFLLMEKKRTILKGLAVGILLSFTVLLRRHFVYPVIALGITSLLFDLWRSGVLTQRLKRPCITFLVGFWPFVAIGAIGCLYLIAPIFFWNALSIDYTALYASYKRSTFDFVNFVGGRFGFLLLALSITGVVLSWRRGVFFITLMAALCLFLWVTGPSQAGAHYMIHVVPLFIIIGITGLFLRLQQERHTLIAWVAPIILLFLLMGNTLMSMVFADKAVNPNEAGDYSLFSAKRAPIVRKDKENLLALGKLLLKEAKAQDRIVVLGSSFVFNQDLMRIVLQDVLENQSFRADFLRAAEIDNKESTPFNEITSANLYLVPSPPQYHLDPKGQKVVTAAASLFPPDAILKPLFKKVGKTVTLDKRVKVDLWRREAWNEKALHHAINLMREKAPSSQRWIFDEHTENRAILRQKKQAVLASFILTPQASSLSLFLADGLIKKTDYTLAFDLRLEGACLLDSITLITKNQEGSLLNEKTVTSTVVPGHYTMKIKEKEDFFLRLAIQGKAVQGLLCRVTLDNLDVTLDPTKDNK